MSEKKEKKRLQPLLVSTNETTPVVGVTVETESSKKMDESLSLQPEKVEKEEKIEKEDKEDNEMDEESITHPSMEIEDLKTAREYETWKANTIYLYSFLTTYETPFPAATTFDWGTVVSNTSDVTKQSFIYGTNEVDDTAYIGKCVLSIPTGEVKPTSFKDGNVGEFDCDVRYDDSGLFMHKGDVRRLRAMPQNRDVVVTSSSENQSFIYNTADSLCEGVERKHGGGFGLSWSIVSPGTFCVCENGNVYVYTINNENEEIAMLNVHNSINDVCFKADADIILSVGEDSRAVLTDIRTKTTVSVFSETHSGDANACCFDQGNSYIFITGGGEDGFVRFWDTRKPNFELCHLFGAEKGINCCQLSTINLGYVCSASKDNRVRIYDMSRVGEDQTSNDADDGGSEFLFQHNGHFNEVYDALWNPNIPFVIGSAGEGREIQFWRPMKQLMKEDRTILKPAFLH
ncbi:histone acetyltransferase type B subunit, putative [Entamoeba invadens IP1]|uniref:Histone acetyltransferase type B subunit, putative n=1 Tax=Entamoeba invadens IP1 TaxID=370355 RepID=A0A0A1UGQ1_ENTIV|nr:histone acetyltransferase type B subunit, putative [Entamoeba invadens IP1]ELP92918.1 histone acetyltransferase type B subunit, putative [Entamoeba invadens IP1]|eukprot:XP_004259689.1 histone acetyltransferase type B subunit, putative [Entamoeba invadens IP1]